MPYTVLTSETNPLRIDQLELTRVPGKIGLTFCPGKHQANSTTGRNWARDLDADLQVIKEWGATHLLTLIRDYEFKELKVSDLPAKAKTIGLNWLHAPITDHCAPDAQFEQDWHNIGETLRTALRNGENIVLHCKGGLGRAGTVAARLLLELGECTTADEAVARVRAARPNAVDSGEQEHYLRTLSPAGVKTR